MASEETPVPNTPGLTQSSEPALPAIVKDENYYFENGDCVFLVDGVLFKLPRFNFCRNGTSMFADMFAVAKDPSAEPEPIPLDDSVEDFRALCWVMFALPTEMYTISTKPNNVNVDKYLRILEIAHKYLLPEYESWAWMMARLSPNAISAHLATCSEDQLEHALDLALRCTASAPELLGLVESAWTERIKTGKLLHSRALTVAETRGQKEFEGNIYWDLREKLIAGPKIASPESGFAAFKLTSPQLSRLLFGHAMLSHHWHQQLNQKTTDLPQVANCNYHPNCQSFWQNHIGKPSESSNMDTSWISSGLNTWRSYYSYDYPCVGPHLESLIHSPPKPDNLAMYFQRYLDCDCDGGPNFK